MPKILKCPYCKKKMLSTTYKMIQHIELFHKNIIKNTNNTNNTNNNVKNKKNN